MFPKSFFCVSSATIFASAPDVFHENHYWSHHDIAYINVINTDVKGKKKKDKKQDK